MGALQVHNKFGKPTPSPEDIQSGEVVYVDSRTGLYSVNPDGAVQCLFMVSLANGMANSGYIPNDTAFGALTFQVLGSRLKPGCAETAIVNGLVDLIATTQK
jgi:hypothetical protein